MGREVGRGRVVYRLRSFVDTIVSRWRRFVVVDVADGVVVGTFVRTFGIVLLLGGLGGGWWRADIGLLTSSWADCLLCVWS